MNENSDACWKKCHPHGVCHTIEHKRNLFHAATQSTKQTLENVHLRLQERLSHLTTHNAHHALLCVTCALFGAVLVCMVRHKHR